MIKPRHIQPGDKIGIVAPGSPVTREQIAAGLDLLERRGYRVVLGEHIWEQDGYLAGPDEHRAADLVRMFADKEIKAIIAARGGYGTARTLDHLPAGLIEENPKLLVGYSDITVLHLLCQAEAQLATLYGPMLTTFSVPRPDWVAELWFRAMEVPEPLTLPPPPSGDGGVREDTHTIVSGTAEGTVLGGCLCLLTDSIGTPYEPDTTDAILILEDVDESPHRVDAMLQHLKQSGLLSGVEGIVVGHMTRTEERIDPQIGFRPTETILSEHLASRRRPVIAGFPFGHVDAPMTIPLGIPARLDADAGTLTYLEAATS